MGCPEIMEVARQKKQIAELIRKGIEKIKNKAPKKEENKWTVEGGDNELVSDWELRKKYNLFKNGDTATIELEDGRKQILSYHCEYTDKLGDPGDSAYYVCELNKRDIN